MSQTWEPAVRATQARQHGVVSRRQVLAAGARDVDVERLLRRRTWARALPGVYVDHTGPLSWEQRAWAATLLHDPAALAGASSLRAFGIRTGAAEERAPIDLVVAHARRVDDPPGVRTRRLRDFDAQVQSHLSPPRQRLEPAVLTVASSARDDDRAVAVLADACQLGRTTPDRLSAALASMTRLPRRRLLVDVVADVAAGTMSPLERRYLRDVERAHALPPAQRQVRAVAGGAIVYRDVVVGDHGVLIELDGRLGHELAADRWRDLERDLESLASGAVTLRAGWRQVLEPCRLARVVASVLAARGWTGSLRACPRCRNDDRGGSSAPGAEDPPLSVR
ncbi:hypothetical protein I601_3869 [Nocardioides dokdonensis FR1436]|uniref:DUF559 domain-containing protein n=1 Tax=Nocardioides dokdonensis FR1436 TaxID=1300347 RepID=A0A1A9GPL0_9ACTN|nr:hypothetical protein [Nocardioides dokdonensis]ANH40267.1 hypothetical protein I601_3869 [Nocardioides dokdonensis FR1436]